MSMKKMLAVVAAASLVAVAAPAFAANPFSDVPMNHWAYDAVEQLTAKGILEGYPNGTFKGNRAMTRYEIATMVARMMANGVGGADADKLKALIVEFAPELEALGVKVDGFDGRLSALEKGLGGWKLTGQMRFDIFSHKDNVVGGDWNDHGSNFNRARLFLHRDLSNKVSFDARWNTNKIDRFWVTAKDFLGAEGLTAKIGSFYADFESKYGLYENNNMWDDDANFYDGTIRGVDLEYKRGGFEVEAFYNTGAKTVDAGPNGANAGKENYGARIAYNGAKFGVSANGYWFNEDGLSGMNYKTYFFTLGFKPFRGVGLTGAYYMQDMSSTAVGGKDGDDSPKMWKVVLTLDQDLLKFTSLRFEYAKYDDGFYVQNGYGPMMWHANIDHTAHRNIGGAHMYGDTKWLKVSAIQKWGAKFSTYERYAQYDQDDHGKAKELQLGIGYQYSPNLWFGFDWTKCEGNWQGGVVDTTVDDDKIFRFRTVLNF